MQPSETPGQALGGLKSQEVSPLRLELKQDKLRARMETREDRSKGHCLHLGAHLGLDPCITPGTGELQLASQACSVYTQPHHHAWEQAQARGSTGHPLEEPESHRARPTLAEQCPLSKLHSCWKQQGTGVPTTLQSSQGISPRILSMDPDGA